MTATQKPVKKPSVTQSAIAMAMGTFSSRILGFLRDAIMLALFPRSVTDAWVTAFRLPNLFRRLLGEGSLSVSFIPVYVDARKGSAKRAHQLADAVHTIVLAVSVVISLVCLIFMEDIMWALVGDPHGYAAIPGKMEQTIYLARIMIFYLALVTTYAFYTAIANTLGHYFVPAIGPTLFNFGLILFTLTHFELGSYPGSTQAWGVIFGGVLQMGVVGWLLWKTGHLPRVTLKWRMPEVGQVFRTMLPGLFGLGVFQVMTIVNTMFAARLGEGPQTYIYTADRVLELPQSLIAVSLGAALLPRFSDLHSSGERAGFLREANAAVRLLFFLSLPAAIGMYVLAMPITQVLFMRGEFRIEAAAATAAIVRIYAVLMLFSSLSRVTAPAFYAMKNTRLPAFVAFFVLLVHIGLGSYLVDEYGLEGLASATSFSSILNIVVLQIFFFYMIGPLGYGSVFGAMLRLLPALGAMGLVCWFGYEPSLAMFGEWFPPDGARTSALFLIISVSVVVYFWISLICGSSEAVRAWGILKRRLGLS